MKKIIALMLLISLIGFTAAETCDVPGSGCSEEDWANPNCAGAYGGFDGVGCNGIAMVVTPGTCDGSDDEASVDIDGGELDIVVTSDSEGWDYCEGYGHLAINWIMKDGDDIEVRYLDGFDDDAFDIYFEDEYVCSVSIKADGQETWETAECEIEDGEVSVPEFASVGAALIIVLTAPGFAYLLTRKRK